MPSLARKHPSPRFVTVAGKTGSVLSSVCVVVRIREPGQRMPCGRGLTDQAAREKGLVTDRGNKAAFIIVLWITRIRLAKTYAVRRVSCASPHLANGQNTG